MKLEDKLTAVSQLSNTVWEQGLHRHCSSAPSPPCFHLLPRGPRFLKFGLIIILFKNKQHSFYHIHISRVYFSSFA